MVTLFLYCGAYLLFRQSQFHPMDPHREIHLDFPTGKTATYYFFWPLITFDTKVLGTPISIGPYLSSKGLG